MADTYTKFDNSAKDLPKQVQQDLNTGKDMFQTYTSQKVDMSKMFGKFNQTNTMNGVTVSGESRK